MHTFNLGLVRIFCYFIEISKKEIPKISDNDLLRYCELFIFIS